jgi:hypothetical protein
MIMKNLKSLILVKKMHMYPNILRLLELFKFSELVKVLHQSDDFAFIEF